MVSQRVWRRTIGLAVVLVVALAAFEARAQPPVDRAPPGGFPIEGPPSLPGLPPLPPLPGPPGRLPMDGMPEPPVVGVGMGPRDGGRPMPGPTSGGPFRPPGPPDAPAGPGLAVWPGRAPGGAVGLGGGLGPGLIPTATGLLEELESTPTYFNAFWMFAALGLGLVIIILLVMLVLLMKLMKLMQGSVAKPREHVAVG